MVASGMKTKEITDKAQRKKLLELGIRTCILVASMQEIVTVGVMVKTCELFSTSTVTPTQSHFEEWHLCHGTDLSSASTSHDGLSEHKTASLHISHARLPPTLPKKDPH